jgi:hypothetical protein
LSCRTNCIRQLEKEHGFMRLPPRPLLDIGHATGAAALGSSFGAGYGRCYSRVTVTGLA